MSQAKRAAHRTIDFGSHALGNALDRLRRGDRVVLCTPPTGMRLGNFLYLWLNAHLHQAEGADVMVRESYGMAQWLQRFPALRELTLAPREVRFSDRREWDPEWLYQRFGVDFGRDQLHAFVREVFAGQVTHGPPARLVVNVRRGDFYATQFEAKHGFQIVPYVQAALKLFPERRDVLVVSDDAEWCRTRLDRMLRDGAEQVDYAAPDPLRNLLALAGSHSLIGANSTFSYWGAYIADALHDDARIVMPRFHARMAHGSDAYQLDPSWTALDGFA
ncbi:alpha-1,2-fucosyltransferase [Microbacterium sp.]|uniref:alpha-1,2-fucosyltransferase n=1 Tax=Microbacterium sp. TaxID=51671 RepID=UPI002811C3F7|nr:alpha-1,2-fucosyltransferase [Microbacterium sp.]